MSVSNLYMCPSKLSIHGTNILVSSVNFIFYAHENSKFITTSRPYFVVIRLFDPRLGNTKVDR